MRIDYTTLELEHLLSAETAGPIQKHLSHVVYDTRKIVSGKDAVFVCLRSTTRDGHSFIQEAFEKGVRVFIVEKRSFSLATLKFPDTTFLIVQNCLEALQLWASFHRSQFNIPVIGITGSAGKTIVKEWLYNYLSVKYKVARSPKSFNSQLGVAISLFEINSETQIALIEAGISEPNEMNTLVAMIQPTHGVLTSLGANHIANFENEQQLVSEKLILFKSTQQVFMNHSIEPNPLFKNFNIVQGQARNYSTEGFTTIDESNIALCENVAQFFGLTKPQLVEARKSLKRVQLRLETVKGINQSQLILDAYNRTYDGLDQALAYQAASNQNNVRILVIHLTDIKAIDSVELNELLNRYSLKEVPYLLPDFAVYSSTKIAQLPNRKQSILLKGNHPNTLALGNRWKERKHQTYIEVSLDNLAYNLKQWKAVLPKNCTLLAMVKASSYGTEIGELGRFLEQQQVGAIGVAYTDEGVTLRENGLSIPILVMNADKSNWEDCLKNKLEPSIYSMSQLESLARFLQSSEIIGFPIHIKLDTGMRRLGFLESDLPLLINSLLGLREMRVISVFSHLADADNPNPDFTNEQVELFEKMSAVIAVKLGYEPKRHLLNSDGTANPDIPKFDMIRLGIGLYGITNQATMQDNLKRVLSWNSVISQVKKVEKGDTVGYSRSFIATRDMFIAIIPVGYADGYKRSLSQGNGGVWIDNKYCPVVGNVCMDMIMVEVSQNTMSGDVVEIIGPNQSIRDLAKAAQTIPYEIMTGLSARMPRVFVQNED